VVEMRHFAGDRGQVRQSAVECALGLLLRILRAEEGGEASFGVRN
jgi:nicotinamide mononucleotide (NMN) deamidase PncC